MISQIRKGKAHLFGNNIDTDQIYPAKFLEYTEIKGIKKHALSGSPDPNFVRETVPGDFVIAGTNFGCGSSREQAAITLKANKVGAIVAESFARIFFRNAINLGLPVVTCKGIHANVHQGDEVKLDLKRGEFEDLTNDWSAKVEPLDPYILNILNSGGIKPLMQKITGYHKEGD